MKKHQKYAHAIFVLTLFIMVSATKVWADSLPLGGNNSQTSDSSASSPLLASKKAGTTETSTSLSENPFAKGSRFWSVTEAASRDQSLGEVYLTQLSVGRYLIDNFEIHYGVTLGYLHAKRTKGGVLGGVDFGVRWHFIRIKRWSTFIEGSVGAVVQQNPLTEQSLRFNFNLQPGTGITYRLSQNMLLHAGCRWHHLSNARIRGKKHNLGYDGPMAFIGIARLF